VSLAQMAITVIVAAGIVGVALIVVRQAGVEIPGWVIQVFWIIVACVIGIMAIRFLIGLT
jgi:uncharacterized protein (DUF983 family)